jgi:hypothetical protein
MPLGWVAVAVAECAVAAAAGDAAIADAARAHAAARAAAVSRERVARVMTLVLSRGRRGLENAVERGELGSIAPYE